MDRRIGADRRGLEELRRKSEAFQAEVLRPAGLPDLFSILFIAVGGTVLAAAAASWLDPVVRERLPGVSEILNEYAWKVLLATVLGVAISYTRLRQLEGAGASKVGSVFLYLLVASIGAKAQFAKVLDVPSLFAIGALWITFHAVTLLLLRWRLRAPVFCMAVGSQANIGGAASAPIVASAFHPALAPVGVLIGVLGYVLGTAAGLFCAYLLSLAHQVW